MPTMLSNDVAVQHDVVASFPVELALPTAPDSHLDECAEAIHHEYRASTRRKRMRCLAWEHVLNGRMVRSSR